jgi:hypothetical protein
MKNSLFKLQKRGILFYTQRRARVIANFVDPNLPVDELTYYKQMKEFIKETEGLPKYSQKWWELRNKHYAILRKKTVNYIANESQDTQFLRFYVVLNPDDIACYELISVLNFYQIIYKAFEDPTLSKSIIKQLLGPMNSQNASNYKVLVYFTLISIHFYNLSLPKSLCRI